MWIAKTFAADLKFVGPGASLELFSLIYAACCLIKFATETRRGYFDAFKEHTYLYFNYRIRKPRIILSCMTYKALYVAKVLATFCLLGSVLPKVALLILVLSFAVEVKIYFKYHVMFFLLMGLALSVAPLGLEPGAILELAQGKNPFSGAAVDLYPQLFALSTVCAMYLGAGWHKLNPTFLNGSVVIEQLRFVIEERPRRKHFDGYYPNLLRTCLAESSRTFRGTVRVLMVLTVALELLLPALLFIDGTRPMAMVLGAAMHLGFTVMFPATLLHFSLITVGSYVFFIDPNMVLAFFASGHAAIGQ